MFAVIKTGGKQYRVSPGMKIRVEKLEKEAGGKVEFDKVLLFADGENIKVGTPYITGATVEAEVKREGRDKKKIVFKYHSKTRYKKKKGHRQYFTEVEIARITG